MARKRLSEFRAKTILYQALNTSYDGVEVDVAKPLWKSQLPTVGKERYVVKVDQAVKGRFKKGLVRLDRSPRQLIGDIEELAAKGYHFFLIEPYVAHTPEDERYLALSRTDKGITVTFSMRGGIDIESHAAELQTREYGAGQPIAGLEMAAERLDAIVAVFNTAHMSFLELNPLLIEASGLRMLDAAIEVDEAAAFFVNGVWSGQDIRSYAGKVLAASERQVRELNEQSQASFNLEILNPNGGLFLLLSGGGASVVVADEVNNLGYGDQLANYGEYSGGPNREETKIYTGAILNVLLASTAKQKTLIIAGGVANFTDVKATFTGVVDALSECQSELKQQNVKVYVRRGGPNEVDGLRSIKEYLQTAGILGAVHGPELVLTDIVGLALQEVTS